MSFFVIDRFAVFLCYFRGKMRVEITVFKLSIAYVTSDILSNHSGGTLAYVRDQINPKVLNLSLDNVLNLSFALF